MLTGAGCGSAEPRPRRGRRTLWVFLLCTKTRGRGAPTPAPSNVQAHPAFQQKACEKRNLSKRNFPSHYFCVEGAHGRAGQGPASSQHSQTLAFPSSAACLHFNPTPILAPGHGVALLCLGSPTPPWPSPRRRGSGPPSLFPSPSSWGVVPEGDCQPPPCQPFL